MVDDEAAPAMQLKPKFIEEARALVVTGAEPPMPGRDVHAVYRRLGMFVGSIASACKQVEMLHFAQSGHWSFDKNPRELSEIQSSCWGTKVSTIVAPANPVASCRAMRDRSFQPAIRGGSPAWLVASR